LTEVLVAGAEALTADDAEAGTEAVVALVAGPELAVGGTESIEAAAGNTLETSEDRRSTTLTTPESSWVTLSHTRPCSSAAMVVVTVAS
jgi:hypothetical protein